MGVRRRHHRSHHRSHHRHRYHCHHTLTCISNSVASRPRHRPHPYMVPRNGRVMPSKVTPLSKPAKIVPVDSPSPCSSRMPYYYGGEGVNPLPLPGFPSRAPERPSDPSEAVEVAPGVPGRSPWCPGTVGGRIRSAAAPGAAPHTFFRFPGRSVPFLTRT